MIRENTRRIAVLVCSALAAGACSSGPGGTGSGGNNGAGTAGSSGSSGSGGSASGNAGTTGSAGSGVAGTTGSGGSVSGNAGVTGSGGSASGTAGSTGTGGTTSGSAGTTGSGGTTGAAGSGTAGASGGTSGTAGTIGPGGAPPACQSPPATGGTPGTVDVNLAMTVRATVSPDLMGVHTSVYDANMQLPTTPDLLKQAGVKSLRYPGGSYADLYHWSTHTGTFTPASGAGSNVIFIARDTHFGAFLDHAGEGRRQRAHHRQLRHELAGHRRRRAQEAAAWVAYANGATNSTVSIGADSKGTDWKTVAFWAGLRAAAPLATDDGYNMFRPSTTRRRSPSSTGRSATSSTATAGTTATAAGRRTCASPTRRLGPAPIA